MLNGRLWRQNDGIALINFVSLTDLCPCIMMTFKHCNMFLHFLAKCCTAPLQVNLILLSQSRLASCVLSVYCLECWSWGGGEHHHSIYICRETCIPVYEQSMSLIFLQDVSNVMQDMHVHISASASSVAMGNGKIESEDLLSQQERQSSIHVAGLKVGCNMFKVVPLSAVCIHIMQHVPHRSTHNKHYFCLAYYRANNRISYLSCTTKRDLSGWELVSYTICHYKREFFLTVHAMKFQPFICLPGF